MKYYLHGLRHYPASTLWSFAKVASIVVLVALVATGTLTLGPVMDAVDSVPSGEPASGVPASEETEDPGIVQEGYNLNRTESVFIQYLNQERSSRGLQNVSTRPVLTEMGRAHSRGMAEKDYFAHEEPDGDTIRDRYQQRGLLPECRLPISGTDRYYAGAENIAQLHVDTQLRSDWAEGGTFSIYDEEDLARAIFEMWMHSEGHREAMLVASADEAGLGIYITETGEVYASLELC